MGRQILALRERLYFRDIRYDYYDDISTNYVWNVQNIFSNYLEYYSVVFARSRVVDALPQPSQLLYLFSRESTSYIKQWPLKVIDALFPPSPSDLANDPVRSPECQCHKICSTQSYPKLVRPPWKCDYRLLKFNNWKKELKQIATVDYEL